MEQSKRPHAHSGSDLVDWFIWLPIMRQFCTLNELRSVYTLSDLVEFHQTIAQWDTIQTKLTQNTHGR
ncbi:Uncharacterized protein MCB1EB_1304 [Mycoavidus cysteinexigens]|uniref:Uncharacterized protein n=1 Tax=Mycoavidus cysteinexigens TaxID=1553431 RepID=A0A2Z6EWJ7_9BURK|nr:Uncharacterized protein MCB1EB_1304 [Mycoavidus cysteinexigens]GLR01287.1 hypothetical protein GCM10007934_10990 [Mycoavidus cysteinexigens]